MESSASGPAILMIVGGFLTVLSLIVLFATGSFLAVLVLWALVVLILVVLASYGIIDVQTIGKSLAPTPEKAPTAPTPTTVSSAAAGPIVGSEVFHVSDNQFTYDEAEAVCAAYGAQLATMEQVIDAYNHGAEWCGYGWTTGGMALYPTQKATWEALQREIDPAKRTACGRPGVNGGYFNPSTKFGVNCFGFKPAGTFSPPSPLPGTDPTKFKSMVNKFKSMLKTFDLSPFSRGEWSGYDSTPQKQLMNYGSQFQQSLGGLTEGFTSAAEGTIEAAGQSTSAYSAAPYGLMGATGPAGPAGAAGKTGPQGPVGAQGPQGVQGLPGPQGNPGPTGPQGVQGPKGDKGDMGPTGARGLQGPPGAAGSSVGVVGPKGDTGPAGPKGDKGDRGAQGPAGAAGPQGPIGPQGPQGLPGPAGVLKPAKINAAAYKPVDNSASTDVTSIVSNLFSRGSDIPVANSTLVPNNMNYAYGKQKKLDVVYSPLGSDTTKVKTKTEGDRFQPYEFLV